MTYEFVCKYCGFENIFQTQCFPDCNFCQKDGCNKNQKTGEVNKAESKLTLTYHDTSFGRRFKSK